METPLPDRVKFGTFELDIKAGELLKGGRKITLQEQPFRVLLMLAEHPGQVVTREEIQKRLWPNDTVVEFDHSINTAIRKLRRALGDSAECPKYVETIASRGYRLLVPVERGIPPTAGIPNIPAYSEGESQREAGANHVLRVFSGQKISHYRVLEVLGGGGMGVVYRAEDLKLGRGVALKFLPEELGNDPNALERFGREARAASALDHPNICSVYEFGDHEGQPFIAMPLLEGKTLRDRIEETSRAGMAMPPGELLDLSIQIAEGLTAAHQKGIIHRDIKPANIFITRRGEAKILDFGLAKMADLGFAVDSSRQSDYCRVQPSLVGAPTTSGVMLKLTRTGIHMGTAAYMSPEQVRHEELDARTDLYSFGLVLYEMATGQQAFSGETAAILHDAILNRTPTPTRELNPEIPFRLTEIVNKALHKNRQHRYQVASDMCADLKHLKLEIHLEGLGNVAGTAGPSSEDVSSTPIAQAQVRRLMLRRRVGAASLAVFLVLAISFLPWGFHPARPTPRVLRTIPLTRSGQAVPVSKIRVEKNRLWFTEMAGANTNLAYIPEEGGDPTVLPTPFSKVDLVDINPSESELLVGVTQGAFGPRPFWLIPTNGGSPKKLGDVIGYDAEWSRDGLYIVYSREHDIYMINNDASQPRKLASVPDNSTWAWDFSWSADDHLVRFTLQDLGTNNQTLWEVQADIGKLRPLPVEEKGAASGQSAQIIDGSWTPDGKYFLFRSIRDGLASLWAIREEKWWFHSRLSSPVQVFASPDTIGPLSFSKDGKKLFFVDYQPRRELARYDQDRQAFVPYLSGIPARSLSFSQDGQRVAYASPDGPLWRSRADGSERLQLTFLPLLIGHTALSPDGSQVAFVGKMHGSFGKLYLVSFDGGLPQVVVSDDLSDADLSWSPDSNSLLFRPFPRGAIRMLDLRTRSVRTLPGSEGFQGEQWSPNARYAVATNLNGQKLMLFDFHTQQWSDLASGNTIYGAGIRWSADSRYVYYQDLYKGEGQPIFRVAIRDRAIEQVTSSQQMLRADVLSYTMVGLTPDGAPVVLLNHKNSDIYALDVDLP